MKLISTTQVRAFANCVVILKSSTAIWSIKYSLVLYGRRRKSMGKREIRPLATPKTPWPIVTKFPNVISPGCLSTCTI